TVRQMAVGEESFSGSGSMSAITCPAEAASLAPGGEVACSATYTLTQADVDAGSVTNTATATGIPPSGTPVDSAPSTATVTMEPAPGLTLQKTAAPATVRWAGEVVSYSFLVTNSGNVTIEDLTIEESAFSGTGELSPVTCPATSLAASAQTTCTATYTVTQADVDAGDLSNTATATGSPPTGPQIESPPDTASVTTPDAPGLSLVKSAAPSGPDSLKPGAQITYSFVVTNTGNVSITGVTVAERSFTGTGSMSAITCPAAAARVAPGTQVTCTAAYTVTQADVDAGSVTNTATATGTPPSGTPITSPPGRVIIPQPPAASLSMVKTADVDRLAAVGQKITYSFLVTNTGNVTLRAVAVDEVAFTGSGELSPVTCPAATGSLAPGEQATCTATYTVTQADLDRDSLDNTAAATGTPPSGTPVTSPPDTVTVRSTGAASLELAKEADAIDVDGDGAIAVGDRIEWTIRVTNTGTVTVRGINVSDPTAGKATCPRSMLKPARSMTCTVKSHTVSAGDVRRKSVRNTAVATGSDAAGRFLSSNDDTATVVLAADESDDPSGVVLPDTGAGPWPPVAAIAGITALMAGAFMLLAARRRRSTGSAR
ncbi:hypothetical protein E7Z54_06105, partial [Nocardioides sp.]